MGENWVRLSFGKVSCCMKVACSCLHLSKLCHWQVQFALFSIAFVPQIVVNTKILAILCHQKWLLLKFWQDSISRDRKRFGGTQGKNIKRRKRHFSILHIILFLCLWQWFCFTQIIKDLKNSVPFLFLIISTPNSKRLSVLRRALKFAR